MTTPYSLPGVFAAGIRQDRERINSFKAKRMAEEAEAVWANDFEHVNRYHLGGHAYRFLKTHGYSLWPRVPRRI